jgi:histidine triad (HIT) family protein
MVSESETAAAFMDAFPLAPGHTLVVPKAHRRLIQDMTASEVAGVFGMVAELTPKTDGLGGATLLAVHNGQGAGQEVPHMHVHLVPRHVGDSGGPIHSMFPEPAACSGPELDNILARLRS